MKYRDTIQALKLKLDAVFRICNTEIQAFSRISSTIGTHILYSLSMLCVYIEKFSNQLGWFVYLAHKPARPWTSVETR